MDNYAYGPDARLNSWVILEKGNRIDPERLALIRQAAADDSANAGMCAIM